MPLPTDREWSRLTREEKRKQRQEWLFNPQGTFASPEAEKNYQKRAQRLIDTYSIKEPDRVPVNMSFGSLPAFLYGSDYRTVIYDSIKTTEIWTKFNDAHSVELDSFANPAMLFQAKVYDLLNYRLYTWPGHGLPESASGFQYVEGEYMRADEYDAFINDPTNFMMRTYLPRVIGLFEPLRTLSPLLSINEQPFLYLIPLSMPQMQAVLQTLIEIGKETGKLTKLSMEFNRMGKERGFPMSLFAGFAKAPFDVIGDTLRGMKGMMMDMYRQPGKIAEAIEVITPMLIESAIQSANLTRGLSVFFPLHKGADGWMNSKQFETLYWPSLKRMVNALIEEGIHVILFAEGGYNSRLESVNEFPKGTVCWFFDKTDMARAKKILGDKCSLQGNVPSSMLVAGSPGDVKEYCRKLIEVCGPGGGFILSPGAVGVDEAKIENLKAMVQAAKEYGVYKK